ncbi:MAG TPA: hypothetical protein VL025_02420, partial [Thermoanaerobaculia bacterium]|nr:hypothetical protein [Thermoanaerobaculia bacterium]
VLKTEPEAMQRQRIETAIRTLRAAGGEEQSEQALRDRVEQLERETEVLKEQVRELQARQDG